MTEINHLVAEEEFQWQMLEQSKANMVSIIRACLAETELKPTLDDWLDSVSVSVTDALLDALRPAPLFEETDPESRRKEIQRIALILGKEWERCTDEPLRVERMPSFLRLAQAVLEANPLGVSTVNDLYRINQSLYALVVKERDFERVRYDRLAEQFKQVSTDLVVPRKPECDHSWYTLSERFNGGNPVWTCDRCETIVGRVRPTPTKEDQ